MIALILVEYNVSYTWTKLLSIKHLISAQFYEILQLLPYMSNCDCVSCLCTATNLFKERLLEQHSYFVLEEQR